MAENHSRPRSPIVRGRKTLRLSKGSRYLARLSLKYYWTGQDDLSKMARYWETCPRLPRSQPTGLCIKSVSLAFNPSIVIGLPSHAVSSRRCCNLLCLRARSDYYRMCYINYLYIFMLRDHKLRLGADHPGRQRILRGARPSPTWRRNAIPTHPMNIARSCCLILVIIYQSPYVWKC